MNRGPLLLDTHWCVSGKGARAIAIASTRLPGDLHGDPADRLIVATARAHGATLMTKDSKLLAYGRAGHTSVMKA